MRPDADALSVAMALVPGLLSRNRCFDLYSDGRLHRARARAALLRGVVRQLAGASGPVGEVSIVHHASGDCEVRFSIEALALSRKVLVSPLEGACLMYLAHRAGVERLAPSDGDRAAIESALRRLAIDLAL